MFLEFDVLAMFFFSFLSGLEVYARQIWPTGTPLSFSEGKGKLGGWRPLPRIITVVEGKQGVIDRVMLESCQN